MMINIACPGDAHCAPDDDRNRLRNRMIKDFGKEKNETIRGRSIHFGLRDPKNRQIYFENRFQGYRNRNRDSDMLTWTDRWINYIITGMFKALSCVT